MNKQMMNDLPNWEKEYLELKRRELSKQQVELLEGRDIKSHEGMIFGSMYRDWKIIKGYDELSTEV
tara:strand:- start:1277 stop:1474 length:198 start_codon:yes stop_codon:yes gene_type:complete